MNSVCGRQRESTGGKATRAGKRANQKGSPMSFSVLLEVDRASLGGGVTCQQTWSGVHQTQQTGAAALLLSILVD